MLGAMMARLARALTSKVGLALVAALLLGGSAAAVAMANTHGQPFANGLFNTASPTAAHDADDDDKACTSTRTPSASPTHGEDDAVFATATKTATGGSANSTKAAGDDGHEHEGEGAECDGDEHTPKTTRTPEPTERPEGTRTPEP